MTNKFPTSVSIQQLYGPRFKPDPPKSDRGWVAIGLLVGAVVGFVACLIGDSGAYFWPVGGITAFLIWAAGSSGQENK